MADSLNIFRTTVNPGDWTYVWRNNYWKDEPILDPNAWSLGATNIPIGTVSLTLRSLQYWDAWYHQALRIPTGVSPGVYTLNQKGVATAVSVTVPTAPAPA